jgi:hypothetical protein
VVHVRPKRDKSGYSSLTVAGGAGFKRSNTIREASPLERRARADVLVRGSLAPAEGATLTGRAHLGGCRALRSALKAALP